MPNPKLVRRKLDFPDEEADISKPYNPFPPIQAESSSSCDSMPAFPPECEDVINQMLRILVPTVADLSPYKSPNRQLHRGGTSRTHLGEGSAVKVGYYKSNCCKTPENVRLEPNNGESESPRTPTSPLGDSVISDGRTVPRFPFSPPSTGEGYHLRCGG